MGASISGSSYSGSYSGKGSSYRQTPKYTPETKPTEKTEHYRGVSKVLKVFDKWYEADEALRQEQKNLENAQQKVEIAEAKLKEAKKELDDMISRMPENMKAFLSNELSLKTNRDETSR